MNEPAVIINGHTLSNQEVATLRVAIVNYALDLNENVLGEDEQSKEMTKLYVGHLRTIQRKFIGPVKPHPSEMFEDANEIVELPEEILPDPDCEVCDGEGVVYDVGFSDGDSDQKMFLMQDTARDCPKCIDSVNRN